MNRYEENEYGPPRKGWCEACGEPCEAESVDVGIGQYEFWGTRGTDVKIVEVTKCCSATVLAADPNEGEGFCDE